MHRITPCFLLLMALLTFFPAVLAQDAALGGTASTQQHHHLERLMTAQLADPAPIQGVNTAGTVRTCNLANLEALINIMSNGFELLGIIWGVYLLMQLIKPMTAAQRCKKFAFALVPIAGGLAMPSIMNFVVATGRDMNLFS